MKDVNPNLLHAAKKACQFYFRAKCKTVVWVTMASHNMWKAMVIDTTSKKILAKGKYYCDPLTAVVGLKNDLFASPKKRS